MAEKTKGNTVECNSSLKKNKTMLFSEKYKVLIDEPFCKGNKINLKRQIISYLLANAEFSNETVASKIKLLKKKQLRRVIRENNGWLSMMKYVAHIQDNVIINVIIMYNKHTIMKSDKFLSALI